MFSYVILGQKLSMAVLACCGVIVAGFLFGIKEEDESIPNLSFIGVLFGILASMCVALYAIYTKKILPHVDDNIWRLQIYNNANACLLLVIISIVLGELKTLAQFKFWTSLFFWTIVIVTGMFGIAIGYVSSLQIKVTSPLTHNVSGTAKACAQTILACVVFSQFKPIWWWVCNFMVLGGSSAYTYVRMQEMKAASQQATAAQSPENGEDATDNETD